MSMKLYLFFILLFFPFIVFAGPTLSLEGDFDRNGTTETFVLINQTNDPNLQLKKVNYIELQIAHNNKIVTHLKRNEYFGYQFDPPKIIELFNKKIKAIEVTYTFTGEMGGHGEEYFIFDGKEIHSIFKVNLEEGEGGYSCRRDILESSANQVDCILVKEKCAEWEDITKNPAQRTDQYCWNGKIFEIIDFQ